MTVVTGGIAPGFETTDKTRWVPVIMDTFVARQPILNRDEKTVAYELLFRDGIENVFVDIGEDKATYRMISDSMLSADLANITGGKRAFINFPQTLIENDIPRFLPREKVVIEILENVKPVDGVITSIKNLRKSGYRIALDDFTEENRHDALIPISNIVKFDFQRMKSDNIEKTAGELMTHYDVKLLAEKVETYEQFDQAKKLGFNFFQGFFFSTPQMMSFKSIPVAKHNLFKLFAEACKPGADFNLIAKHLKNDVALSLRLLRLVNSAYYRRVVEVDSIKDAVLILGEDRIKKFIMMIAASDIAHGRPDELVKTAILRARMAELSGPETGIDFSGDELFTLGLFSNVDAMLGMAMDRVLTELPFSDRLKKALLKKDSDFRVLLRLIKLYERGLWMQVEHYCKKTAVEEEKIRKIYLDAVKTADTFFRLSSAN